MYEVNTSSRHKKSNKLRWLATDINLNCYTQGVLSLMVKVVDKLRVLYGKFLSGNILLYAS